MTINTHFHFDSKFKSINLSFRFYIPFKPIDNTKFALLSELMDDRNVLYPTKEAMLFQLDNLFGATLRTRVSAVGNYHQLEIRLTGVSDTFIEENIQDQMFQLLSQVVYQPLINEETLSEAKSNLSDRLLRQKEKPNTYATLRAFEIAGENQPLSISSGGTYEEIENIQLEDMLNFHQSVIKEAMAVLLVVGHFDQDRATTSINSHFKSHPVIDSSLFAYKLNKKSHQHVSEVLPISQASLIKIYSSQINIQSPNYEAYRLGTIILGQLPTSYLFQEVREKHSLAYSVGATTIGFDGVLLMNTQLANQNISLANQLMDEQLNKIKTGNISEALLDGAKLMIHNSLLTVQDDETLILHQLGQSVLTNNYLGIQERFQRYQQVEIEDIVKAFCEVNEILTYELRGNEND